MRTIDVVAAVLVVVGALNWGLVGALDFNLVHFLFGASILARLVYILVGVAGVFQIVEWKAIQRRWTHTPHMA